MLAKLLILWTAMGFWQVQAATYNQPSKEILDVMRAPSLPDPSLSPTRDHILLVSTQMYPSIDRVAEPFLRLAGVRIEPRNHSKHDTAGGYGITACAESYWLVTVANGHEQKIDISKIKCAGRPVWSANGKYFFFKNQAANSVELWIGTAETAHIHRINDVKLNPMFEYDVQWMPDQKHLLVKMLPKNLGAAPSQVESAVGPSIQESKGKNGISSTYEKRDTLNNQNDEKLFDYYGISQLALVNVENGKITPFETPALYGMLAPAPDGEHILTEKIVRPYSYIVTYDRFPKKIEALEISNLKDIKHSPIAELPLADRVPVHGVPTGPRDFSWRATDPATLLWSEALDGGDWNATATNRDKLMMLTAPFNSAPKEIFRLEQRIGGIEWFIQRDQALLAEYDVNKHWQKMYVVNVDDPAQGKKVLWSLSWDDHYADPGQPVTDQLPNGFWVIRQSQKAIFLSGRGSSPDGDHPFLDKFDLQNFKKDRLFQSGKGEFETFLSFVDSKEDSFLIWHQSVTDVPNVFKYNSTTKDKPVAITHIADPTPQVRQIKKQLVKYKRADGVDLSFTIFTPPGYKEGTRVPAILYAYPLDYADAAMAGQVTGSEYTFTQLRQYRLLLLAGYAIIDRASFPIVGDPKKAYDKYLDQLVADAKAAVDQAVKMGIVDPDRIGVTGHSHGALMTVNLLAHSGLFKAGVATSGSYNKTLTPFGFQNERRSVWEAPTVYQQVSPFFYADKIKTPLLIMHGAEDANPGTTPIQAEFLYEAIRGNGGTVRLVVLPHEPHWYTARESNEQEVYEMMSWFDAYVKPVKQ